MGEQIHFTLECLFFLSGIALTIIAAIGLRQLTIAKEVARIGAKRESLRLTADECSDYMKNIIPAQDELDKAVKVKHVTFLAKSHAEVKGSEVKVTSTATADEVGALRTIFKEFQSVFNAMEAFAVFFISGVADEGVAFSALGKNFCHSMRKYLPIIMMLKSRPFDNALELFFLWNARLEAQDLQMKRQQLDQRLAQIQNKFIKPVGT